jgi:hypothetical protein
MVGIAGERDQSLDEQGRVELVNGQFEVNVTFETVKFSDDYEFNCYVENTVDPMPTVVQWQPQARSKYASVIALAPAVDSDNYVFYWHVRVRDAAVAVGPIVDAPEAARTPLLPGADAQTIQFTNPRSSTNYTFSEFRVENLVDGDNQLIIWVQLKAMDSIPSISRSALRLITPIISWLGGLHEEIPRYFTRCSVPDRRAFHRGAHRAGQCDPA